MRSVVALSAVLLAASLVVVGPAAARLPGSSAVDTAAFVSACGIDAAADVARTERMARIRRELHGAASAASDVRERVVDRVAPMREEVEAELREMIATSRAWIADDRDGALTRLASARLAWPSADGTSDELDLRRGCGEDLLVDDAWVDKHATTIVVCPGFLLVSASGEGAWQDAIAFLLAHEVGHVVVGPTARGRDSEHDAEIAADRWASRLLDARLARAEPSERAAITRHALEPICGPATDPVHPSGRERIAVATEAPRIASSLAL